MKPHPIRDDQLINLVEATLFSSDKPVSIKMLKEVVLDGFDVSTRKLQSVITQLQTHYQERGVQLVKVATGYRFQTHNDYAPILNRLTNVSAPKYSRAMLETLALIAYKQPITRAEIESVRGVAVSSQTIKTMVERDWVKVVGHKDVPGKPRLYATTSEFLSYFGLSSISQLPALQSLESIESMLAKDSADVERTQSQIEKESINE